jgi:gamma-glutamylcyclotransferase (GGCT)/AIG2-like uncharacterized protein YtfP
MPRLFSYGSLQEERVQLATFGRRLEGHHDELVCFELSKVEIKDPHLGAAAGKTHHANATFTGNDASRVRGMVFEVTEAELAAADTYEAPADYTRITAALASGTETWVYVYRGEGQSTSLDHRCS